MTVVFDHVSAIGTRLNVPDASIFNLVARIVSERLPISVIVGIVSGLSSQKQMDIGNGEISVWPTHFEYSRGIYVEE